MLNVLAFACFKFSDRNRSRLTGLKKCPRGRDKSRLSIGPTCASLNVLEKMPAGENVLMVCVIAGVCVGAIDC